jgi:type VI secretion system secreted protein Hcp
MSLDKFLKVDGIKGESQDVKHRDEIDVLSWSWGLAQSSSPGPGGGAGAGRVSFRDLSIGKRIDAASPKLMLSCASGQHIQSAQLTEVKGQPPIEYLKIKIEDVLVSSVAEGEPAADGNATEAVTFKFGRVHVDYVSQNSAGGPGSSISFGWDLTKNAKI